MKHLKALGIYVLMCCIAALMGLAITSLTGCGAITPEITMPEKPSYYGNVANSGLLYQIPEGGFVISKSLYKEYKSLLKKYHGELKREKDYEYGVTESYIITDEVMHDLLKMKTWEKNPWLLDEK